MIPYSKHTVTLADSLRVAYQIQFRSLTQGKEISKFEKAVAGFVGCEYAIAVSSATAGLHLAVMALELKPGSPILTSPNSFVASSNAILYSNHIPKFDDIAKDDLMIPLNSPTSYSGGLKAIIPVHFAGLPPKSSQFRELSTWFSGYVIEDAAHSFGATYDTGENVGSCIYSDMTVLSFHPVKSITTGEGGLITTNNSELAHTLLSLRSHGINKRETSHANSLLARTNSSVNPWYYEMLRLGFNYRMTEIQAALGISQLRKLKTFMEKREEIAQRYRNFLLEVPHCVPAQSASTKGSSNHLFPIRIDYSKLRISRVELMSLLRSRGIGTQVHYIPIPWHPFYQELGYGMAGIPNTAEYYFQALSLPCFPKLGNRDQKYVVDTLASIISRNSL